jgi:hypothetical protein
VLRGDVERDRMINALPERLAIIERRHASMRALVHAIDDLQAAHPGEPILVAVDYVQLVPSEEREIRMRVADAMVQLDDLARSKRVVILALSQSSRASSRALSNGEKVGAEAADTGAEAADVERWASALITIGRLGAERDDGTRAAELSIAVQRMEAGDRVVAARFHGRSGLWRLAGEARPTADAIAERASEIQITAERLIIDAAVRATQPQTREAVEQAAREYPRAVRRAAMGAALARGALVEVEQRKKRSRAKLVWTRENAAAAGIPVTPQVDL